MIKLEKDERVSRISRLVADLINNMTDRNLVLNLGTGIPSYAVNYINNPKVFIHSENGILGAGPLAAADQVIPDLINAGRQPVLETPGCVYFDSAESFGMIRGGHIDVTVMGAFQVDSSGRLANWTIPGGGKLGVGGAMDLVCGARKIIIAMTHVGTNGPKLVKKCVFPLTGLKEVDYVVTEYAIFHFRNNRFSLIGITDDITREEIQCITELDYDINENLVVYPLQGG